MLELIKLKNEYILVGNNLIKFENYNEYIIRVMKNLRYSKKNSAAADTDKWGSQAFIQEFSYGGAQTDKKFLQVEGQLFVYWGPRN